MKLTYSKFTETNGLKQIPMTSYCIGVRDKNGNVHRQAFNLEMPDGSDPVMGSSVVNAADYGSIGGGDYVKSLVLPEITDFSVNLATNEVSVTVSLNDVRITELELKFWNSESSTAAWYNIYDVAGITSTGSQVYTLGIDDLSFNDESTISDIVSMTAIVYDTGNGQNSDLDPYSELGTWGYPTDL